MHSCWNLNLQKISSLINNKVNTKFQQIFDISLAGLAIFVVSGWHPTPVIVISFTLSVLSDIDIWYSFTGVCTNFASRTQPRLIARCQKQFFHTKIQGKRSVAPVASGHQRRRKWTRLRSSLCRSIVSPDLTVHCESSQLDSAPTAGWLSLPARGATSGRKLEDPILGTDGMFLSSSMEDSMKGSTMQTTAKSVSWQNGILWERKRWTQTRGTWCSPRNQCLRKRRTTS